MCQAVKAGRDSGRRQSVVIVAEGAQDLAGNPITAHQIKTLLEDQLGEDARITILGHVQRGGAPSAFDRYLSTLLGNAAVERLLTDDPHGAGPAGRDPRQPGRQFPADGLRGADPGGRRADQGAGLRRRDVVARRQLPGVLPDPADHAAGRAAAHPGRPAAFPAGRRARRRPGAGDEQLRPRPRSGSAWTAGTPRWRSRTVSSACTTATSRKWAGWTSAGGCPTAAPRSAPTGTCRPGAAIGQIAETDCRTPDRRPADGRRLGRLRGRLRIAPAPAAVLRPGYPDRLHADDDQQRRSRHRTVHRQRHGAEQHRSPTSTRSGSPRWPPAGCSSSR